MDITTDVVECNKVHIFFHFHLKEIVKLNASLKQEMLDFLAIYDVLQYFFSPSFPVECGEEVQVIDFYRVQRRTSCLAIWKTERILLSICSTPSNRTTKRGQITSAMSPPFISLM